MASYDFKLLSRGGAGDPVARGKTLKERPFPLFFTSDEGAEYIPTDELCDAVNVSLATGRPLLLTGEPGTGKTTAAAWVARSLGLESGRFQVKSNSRAQDLLYTFDAVAYFGESQRAAAAAQPQPDKAAFVTDGPLWTAIEGQDDRPQLLLIDEIDKAPRDFPNDLLHELDRMEITCPERSKVLKLEDVALRPVVIITSNSERRLPEPFLRRCIYHHIMLDEAMLQRIITNRAPRIGSYFSAESEFRAAATKCFFALRNLHTLQKRPSIDEFWQWFSCVGLSGADTRKAVITASEQAKYGELPLLSALIKMTEDQKQLTR